MEETPVTVKLPVFYDCARCHAYCCTYPEIPASRGDIRRLARHFAVDVETAEVRFTKLGRDRKSRVLRHRKDPAFLTACRFLEPESRRCTIYDARPRACREYPGSARCGYYDFLAAERKRQDDPDLVLSAWATEV
jgi:Fe-S-cluster containining protein